MILMAVVPSFADAGPARIGGDPARDVRQTIQARKRLADDPDLSAWNIGVTVRDRVAVLWGPVPSAEIAFRAELCLRTIIELAEVRNELFLSDQVKPRRVPLNIDNPPLFLPAQPLLPSPKGPRSVFPTSDSGLGRETLDLRRPMLKGIRATLGLE